MSVKHAWANDRQGREAELLQFELQFTPALESLEENLSQVKRFLASSLESLEKMERNWTAKLPEYEQKLVKEGERIEEAGRTWG